MKKQKPPSGVGNVADRYTLNDWPWERDGDGFAVRSKYKMRPAMHGLDPQKRYQITLNNGISYTGAFQRYVYKKPTLDSPLVAVYYELNLDTPGQSITMKETEVQGFIKLR